MNSQAIAVIIAAVALSLFTSKPCPKSEQTNTQLVALAQTQQASLAKLAADAATDSKLSAKAYDDAAKALAEEKKRLSQQGCKK